MNIFVHEQKMAHQSMLWWIVALSLVTLMFISLYPSFSSDIEASQRMLESFPEQVRAMFSMSFDVFRNFLGYYAYIFTYIGLAGAIQAMNLGLTMLNREMLSKTNDFLLTRPVSRERIFFEKLLSALTILICTNIALIAVTLILSVVFSVGTFSLRAYGLLALSFLLVQLIFFSLGVLITQVFGKIKSVISVSLGVAFGFFAISLLQSFTNDDKLRYLTPFKFFDLVNVASTHRYEGKFVILTTLVILVALATSYLIFRKKDTRSVS